MTWVLIAGAILGTVIARIGDSRGDAGILLAGCAILIGDCIGWMWA